MKQALKTTEDRAPAEPPIAKLRDGLITASLWQQTAENGVFFTVTFQRRYRDADGGWKTSHSYDSRDLLALAKLADLAHTKILSLQSETASE